jgi:hypothetical protein
MDDFNVEVQVPVQPGTEIAGSQPHHSPIA